MVEVLAHCSSTYFAEFAPQIPQVHILKYFGLKVWRLSACMRSDDAFGYLASPLLFVLDVGTLN